MAAPAAAAVLRASEFPNIAIGVASNFELMTALVAEGTHSAALDAELKAYTDADGNTPFVDGVTTTEADLATIVEARPQHGDAFGLIVRRYGYDFAL
jgi:hypothetical protein